MAFFLSFINVRRCNNNQILVIATEPARAALGRAGKLLLQTIMFLAINSCSLLQSCRTAPCGRARSTPRSNHEAPDVVSGLERPAGTWVSSAVARWQPKPRRGLFEKFCIVITVYILIMGAIRSFDGRNCEWLSKGEVR